MPPARWHSQQHAEPQSLMHAVAEKRVLEPATAWHCCLEFFSLATRLPPEFRIAPADAALLLEQEILARMSVHDLPGSDRPSTLKIRGARWHRWRSNLRRTHR
jgi:hypothetical protein